MNPQCDIVVPVRDALDSVQKCIDTLYQHTKNFRLLLVDDASQPETSAYLYGVLLRDKNSLLVRTSSQKWFTRAANLGLRLVRTQRAVIMNSDCVVDAGWLEEMFVVWAEAEATGKRVGLVGSTLSAEEQRRWAESSEAQKSYVTGHCWLVSMEAMADIANRRGQAGWYLNEVLSETIHIASDRIGCWELNRAGWATIASHKSAVGHVGGKSWGYNLGRVYSLKVGDPLKGEVLG